MTGQRQGNVTTRVKGWQQRSLFDSATLQPYRKSRWRAIRARLAREKEDAQKAATGLQSGSPADPGK